jgi:SAM-dependent methyltransferase
VSSWELPAGSGDRWAVDYERGRPGWPPEVVDLPGLSPAATVIDLAAGTGKLTRVLAGTFARVLAVEPAGALRQLAELVPEAEVVAGTAQAIPLADSAVDGVFVAEAFHRFAETAALAEIARVLRPGGVLVLLWNLPTGPWQPSARDAERFLEARMPPVDYIPLDLGGPREGTLDVFEGSAFEPLREARFPNPQTLDRDGLVAFYASMGWIADLPDAERLPVLEEVRSRLDADAYSRAWETLVHWTRLATVR